MSQVFIDVDCSNLTYSSPVAPQVEAAALQLEQRRRGWTTEEDKKQKIINNLPDIDNLRRTWSNETISMQYDLGLCSSILINRWSYYPSEEDQCR